MESLHIVAYLFTNGRADVGVLDGLLRKINI